MKILQIRPSHWAAIMVAATVLIAPANAQPARGRRPQGPQVISPEVAADRTITFRILAPKAEAVRLSAGDIPGIPQGGQMTKGTNGVWEVKLDPVPAGAYRYKAALDDAGLKKGLKLFWFGRGKDDFLVETTRATVAMFEKHGFNPVYNETAGAHTWLVWRDYLVEFTPQLFR